MKVFSCPTCGQLVFFGNSLCLRCGTEFAVDPAALAMVAIGGDTRPCANRLVAACNWVANGHLCVSCQLTRTRPADDDKEGLRLFAIAEKAKRRLVFQLLVLSLPLEPRDEVRGTGVAFDLLVSGDQPITTGHASGIITLDLAESDAVHRERVRTLMSEPYRTVLGHFRHEIGHYYHTVLVGDHDRAEVRQLFGDETLDYQAALDRHYRHGAPADWTSTHVTEYATMHPAEDWAETFAHYLHIRSVLHTATSYRVRVDGPVMSEPPLAPLHTDPASVSLDSIEDIIAAWLPLSYALNAMNRSMGTDDLYPFVLRAPVVAKLGLIHRLVQRAAALDIGDHRQDILI